MAAKEATIFIVDVGRSMGDTLSDGRDQTDLEWALTYVWDRMTSTIALDHKTTFQGVIAVRTDDTENYLAEDDEDGLFSNITVLQRLEILRLEHVRALQERLVPSSTEEGDAISAIVLAIQMITAHCTNSKGKPLNYIKQIILLTNGTGPMNDDQLNGIAEKLRNEKIKLTVLGVDFDDSEYGLKEEDKDPDRAVNEDALFRLADQSKGMLGTLAAAIDEMGTPRIKEVGPRPSYKKDLSIGDTEHDQNAISIEVQRYPRVMVRKPPTASSFMIRSDAANGADTAQSSATLGAGQNGEGNDPNSMVSLKTERMYEIVNGDEKAPKGQVPFSSLQKGYEYGRTAVFFSDTDRSLLDMKTTQSLQVLGFIDQKKFERYMGMDPTHFVVAPSHNAEAIIALSSLIHALKKKAAYAIGRLVLKDGKAPTMHVLAPFIEQDPYYECLIDLPLPFAEDVRQYRFPPLDKVVTVSGKVLTEHRTLPTPELQMAMDNFVDSFDISDAHPEEEGQPFASMMETYSPVVHRIDQAVRFLALHPDAPIPPPYKILTQHSRPPAEVLERAEHQLAKLKAVADVKKVPPKSQARSRGREQSKATPISGTDVGIYVHSHAGRARNPAAPLIDPRNAIPSLVWALENPSGPDTLDRALGEMGAVIEERVKTSFGEQQFDRALEELGKLRDGMVEMEHWHAFNLWIRGFREKLLGERLGGDRREFWWRIRKARLGLITQEELELSTVSPDEAKEFMKMK